MSRKMYEASVVSQIKSLELDGTDESLIIEGYANTVTKDRAGDVIPKTAWETDNALTNYLKNPVILAYHDHSQAIGKMIDYEITELGLKVKAKISKGAGRVYDLIKDGVLTTFSVGFGILDAEYDNKTDTYFINDVELREISVVAVPCNQDSVFSLSKSMKSQDFERFKEDHKPVVEKENNHMTKEEMQAMLADLQGNAPSADDIAKAAADAAAKAVADVEAAKTAAAEKAAAEKAAKEAAAAELKANAKEAASELIKELEAKIAEKDGGLSELVKAQNDQIVSLKEEIAQVVAARSNPMTNVAQAVKGMPVTNKEFAQEVDALVMLSVIKEKGIFETEAGSRHKAVNSSSSGQVSSESYETMFSTNLIRDIQAQLVVAPLFNELNMDSAYMTIPVNPNRSNANWVSAANLADNTATARTGNELSVILTERTISTYKLAAKTYLTEETTEDAIIAIAPLLRAHLVEAHAAEMDRAFLVGSGSGEPLGLVTQAEAASGQTYVSTATSTGTVKVTADMFQEARRYLGLYGLNLADISLIISQDAYWDLIQDPEWADVQQVGMEVATKLNGEVGNIYGMKVIVSNEFETKAASTAFAVLVNTSNFVTARQRGLTMRSDFDVELDRTVFVATQRVNLEGMIVDASGNGKGVVSIQYAA